MLIRISHVLFLPILIALLSGCVSTPQVTERPTNFGDDKGFVAIRVITNSPVLDPAQGLSNKWRALRAKSVDGTEFSLLPENGEGRRSSQLFSALLPEGKYRLTALTGGLTASLLDSNLEFDVQKSHITNLGTLIYQPTGNRAYTILQVVRQDDVQSALAAEYPQLYKAAMPNPVLSWKASGNTSDGTIQSRSAVVVGVPLVSVVGTLTVGIMQAISDRAGATAAIDAWKTTTDPTARMSLAKEGTYSLNNLQQMPGGEIIAGTNLGQILLRDPAKGWIRIDTGDARELTAVYASSRQRILAGGEEGTLILTNDGGRTWTHLKPPVASALILHVTEHRGETLVLSLYRNQMYVHSITDLNTDNWTELKRETAAQLHSIRTWPNLQGMAVIQNNKYMFYVPGQSLHVFDLDKRTWTVRATPGFFREITATNDFVVSNSGWRVAPQITRNAGETWTPFENSCAGIYSGIMSLSFLSPSEAYTLCFHTGAFAGSTSLKKTIDGGKTWEDLIRETPVMAMQMFAAKGLIFYSDITGRIYASKDGGATWLVERRAYQ